MTGKYNFSNTSILDWNSDLYNQLSIIINYYNQHIPFDFFNKLYEIINKNQVKNDDEYKKYLAVGKTFFIEANSELNELKLLTAICLIQNIDFFDSIELSPRLVNKLHNLFLGFQFKFGLGKDAPDNENKMMTSFEKAKTQNKYNEILQTMNHLVTNSSVFMNVDSTWGLFFRFVLLHDIDFLAKYLETASFETVEYILYSVRNDIIKLLEKYSYNKNIYPFLRGLNYLFTYAEEVLNQTSKFLDYTDLITVFISDTTNRNQFSDVLDSLYIKHLKTFNYTFGLIVSTNEKFLDFYLSKASLNIDALLSFSLGFISENPSEKCISTCVSRIFETVLEKNNPTHINEDFGCINILFDYFQLKGKTRDCYLDLIVQKAREILDYQNSWTFNNLTKAWIELFYCAMANCKLKFEYTEIEIQATVSILYDKRNELVYDSYSINLIKDFLLKPNTIQEIELVNLENKRKYSLGD